MIDVKIRKVHPDAEWPTYAHPGDAGMDVTAVSVEITSKYIEYDTGLQFQLPPGYVMLIFPRSSNSKYDLTLANSVGVLDSGYTGNLKLRFKRCYRAMDLEGNVKEQIGDFKDEFQMYAREIYDIGDKVGQIMILPYPTVNWIPTEEFEETERGTGGFGSTGK